MEEPSFVTVTPGGLRATFLVRSFAFFAGTTIAVAVIVFLFGRGTFSPVQLLTNALPSEFSGAYLLSQETGRNLVQRVDQGQLVAMASEDDAGATTYIARSAQDTLVRVAVLRSNTYVIEEADNQLLSVETPVMSAAVSPSGRYVAYAGINTPAPSDQVTTNEQPTSHIMLYDGSSAVETDLGAGFAPFFLNDGTLLWFSRQGLVRYDLASKTTTIFDASVRAAPQPQPVLSPDRTLLAWSVTEGHELHVSRVSDDANITIAVFSNAKSPRIALGNDALYSLLATNDGTEVWRYPLANGAAPQLLYTYHGTDKIMQLIP